MNNDRINGKAIMSKQERSSNFELARIICMIMIMILHADNLSLGIPSFEDLVNNPYSSFSRIFAEQLCLIGVNVYVLISGWFGIRCSRIGILKFACQVLFYSTIFFLLKHAIDGDFSFALLKPYFTRTFLGLDYWFVPSYLLLYILSPMINSFVENSPKGIVKRVLMAYFIFVWAVVWLGNGENFSYGYSTIWFVGLYMFARYANLYKEFLSQGYRKEWNLLLYIGVSLIATILMWLIVQYKDSALYYIMLIGSYLNVFVFLASWQFFVYISKMRIICRPVNRIASCIFAVYLIHVNPFVILYYCDYYKNLYDIYNGFALFALYVVSLFCMLFVMLMIERIRQYLFDKVFL